jgi:hypothetical protein
VNDDSPAPKKPRKAFQKRRKNDVCMTRHNKLWSLALLQIISIKSFVSFSSVSLAESLLYWLFVKCFPHILLYFEGVKSWRLQ